MTAANPPTLTIAGTQASDAVHLTATLTGADGRPLAKRIVRFYFASAVFGPGRLFPLGSAPSDLSGTARLTLGADSEHLYLPTNPGPQKFVASSAVPGAQEVTSSTTINVTKAQSAYEPAPPKPLAGVGRTLVKVLFIIVAGVWLTLFVLVLRVRRVSRRVPQPTTASV